MSGSPGEFPTRGISSTDRFKPKLYFITADRLNERMLLKELSNYPIIFPEHGSATRVYIIGEFQKRKIPLKNIIDCESASAIKNMVHLGMGGAFFPLYSIEEGLREDKFTCVEILDDLHLNIDLIYLNERKKSKAVRNFASAAKSFSFP
jgi:DNA-binding transcriptional LysR family regulator